jgi:hypothetical protein
MWLFDMDELKKSQGGMFEIDELRTCGPGLQQNVRKHDRWPYDRGSTLLLYN